ncbi:hypothetical protein GW813_11170 [bacterium]|nr:hypothetical protein [bacterium]
MITTCTECQARYQLEDQKVPRRVIKVRCPDCSGIFSLDGTARAEAEAPLVVEHGGRDLTPQPVAPAPQLSGEPVRAQAPSAGVAVLEETGVAPAASRGRRRRSKEEMYARALVSDILVYNRDARDQALKDGTLVEALGQEIKKSWELYKEKVTPEVANGTDHFKKALNEILAEGAELF